MAGESLPRVPDFLSQHTAQPVPQAPAAIDPDVLPVSFHARAHALTAIWFAVAAVCASTVHAMPNVTGWLWANPVCVVLLLFALSLLAMQTLPRLPRWPVAFVAAMTFVQSVNLGLTAECVLGRYVRAPAAPIFLAAAATLVILAATGERAGAGTTATTRRVFAVSLMAAAISAAAALAMWHEPMALRIGIPVATAFTAILVTADHARSRALARIARDRHPDLAAVRASALLVFDAIYLFARLPRWAPASARSRRAARSA